MDRLMPEGRTASSAMKAWLSDQIGRVTWTARRQARAVSRRWGVVGWGVLVCGLIGISALVFTSHGSTSAAALQAQLVEQAARGRSLPVEDLPPGAAGGAGGRAQLRAFEGFLLPHEDIPLVIQDLLRLAHEEGLFMQRGDYRPQADSAGAFLRYRMTLPVKGPAPAIHRFMQASLQTQKTLALESVQFKRARIESLDTEARIQWVVLAQLPGTGAVATAAADIAAGGAR